MTTHNPKMPLQRPHDGAGTPHPSPKSGSVSDAPTAPPAEHEGADESEVGDRTGPGAGYDDEPKQEKDRGGVS